ncbi:MAG: carboxypeptidase regulatory-like domain-containing protein, partial [Acidobacteria bacterium]|nr:carboxypeptidase regulatory-like domain-containing protein [Acidobacteriota bacterium]
MISIFLLARVCSAQSSQANLSGLVSDGQGAVVVGAQVSIVNAATASTTTVTTNDSGLYAIRALPIGRYTLSVEKPGFKKLVRTNLALTTGQSLELNLTLEVGAVTESISVAATASSIETRSSDVSQLIEAKTIEDMPIGDRRSMNIIGLTGAAVFVNYDAGGKPNFSLAGGRTQSQNFFIDGGTAQNMRLGIGQVDLDPPVETVAEVKILANSYSAEYGGSAGGVVIATTKSGTNQLQGTLFEYFRNEKLDAANYFAPVVNNEKVRAPLRYNVFGGTIGGPVRIPKLYNGKDKTFFFFAYEGSRRNEGVVRTLTVPTVAQRGGDFSLNSNPIFDPATTTLVNGANRRTQFPGNVIPASRLDAAGKNIAAYFPLPNRPADNATGVNNFRANYVTQFPRNNYTAKVDHNLTMNDKLTFRYLYNSDDRFNTTVFPQEAAETLTDPKRHQHYTYLSYNKIITPTMLNELRYTYGNRINLDGSKGLGLDWGKAIGIANLPAGAFPTLNPTGYTSLGAANQERRQLPI